MDFLDVGRWNIWSIMICIYSLIFQKWVPPRGDCFKMNVACKFFERERMFGLGVLIRDGEVLVM